MTTLAEKIAVMQAFADGKSVQHASRILSEKDRVWWDVASPDWDWADVVYRVKPAPKRMYVITYSYAIVNGENSRAFTSVEEADEFLTNNRGAREGLISKMWMVEEE